MICSYIPLFFQQTGQACAKRMCTCLRSGSGVNKIAEVDQILRLLGGVFTGFLVILVVFSRCFFSNRYLFGDAGQPSELSNFKGLYIYIYMDVHEACRGSDQWPNVTAQPTILTKEFLCSHPSFCQTVLPMSALI